MTRKTENKKVKNATPCEADGISFKSKLERYTYLLLKGEGIAHLYEPTFLLQDKFKYNGKHFHPIRFSPDFVGKNWIIECKGFASKDYPLRKKLFLFHLHQTGRTPAFYEVRNQQQAREAVASIKALLGRTIDD